MPTCYGLQAPKTTPGEVTKDISSAAKYGKIVYLLEEKDYPSILPGPTLHKIFRGLRDFNPATDYIFHPGGDFFGLLLLGSVLTYLGHGYFNFLRWERHRDPKTGERLLTGLYVPQRVPLAASFN